MAEILLFNFQLTFLSWSESVAEGHGRLGYSLSSQPPYPRATGLSGQSENDHVREQEEKRVF